MPIEADRDRMGKNRLIPFKDAEESRAQFQLSSGRTNFSRSVVMGQLGCIK